MRILVTGDYTQPVRAPAWSRALRELGADVVEHDWRQDYSRQPLLRHLERRYLLGPGVARVNRRLLDLADEVAPDAVLIYAGQPIFRRTIQALARRYLVAGYQNDDPFGPWGARRSWRPYVEALPAYTCHHVFREANVAEYEQRGCRRVKLLYFYYLPWVHHPVPLAAADRARLGADVVFVGQGQPGARVEYVAALVDAGVALRVYGLPRTWEKYLPARTYRKLAPIVPAEGLDYARGTQAAKVCLALFSTVNRDDYTGRTFEIPACGGFMLSERTPRVQSFFAEGSEAAYFSGVGELLDKIRYYLSHDAERTRIARAGHVRCMHDGHDVVSRVKQWLADLRAWELLPESRMVG